MASTCEALFVAILLMRHVLVSAGGTACRPGYMRSPRSDNMTCSGDATSCADGEQCCVPDQSKCGGQTDTIRCPSGKYADPELAGNNVGLDPEGNCCTSVANCSSQGYMCPIGYRKTSGAENMTCSSDVRSCGSHSSPCCEADLSKCGAYSDCTPWCGKSLYCDPQKAAKTINWYAYGQDGNFLQQCCSRLANCSSTDYSCPVGFKRKQHAQSQLCPSNAESCATSCCEADPTKCAGQLHITCGPGKFLDPMKAGFEVASDPLGNCCSDTAVCKDALGLQAVTWTAQIGSDLSRTGDLSVQTGPGQSLPPKPKEASLPAQTQLEDLLPWLLWGITLPLLCLALCILVRQRQHLMASRNVKSSVAASLPEQVIGLPVCENSMAEKPVPGLPEQAAAIEV